MIIGACLSPTDLVLAASVLAKSRFSDRVPSRIKNVSAFHGETWNVMVM
jgi:sodium/hydrogen antiporter